MSKHQPINTSRRIGGALAIRTKRARHAREAEVAATGIVGRRSDPIADLTLEQRCLDTLRPAARRVRKLDLDHVGEIARSIAAFGFTMPLLINSDGTIIDGHCRYEAAQTMALASVPCILVDHLSEAEQTALKVAVNRLAEKGEWDFDALKLELMAIDELEIDLSVIGFSAPEIDIVLALDESGSDTKREEQLEVEDFQPTVGPPVSRLGDLWQLGEHRLLCGDATRPESYAALMAGATASCLFTDPPYNIPIEGFVSPAGKHGDFAMGVGEMSDDEFQTFLATMLTRARDVLSPGAVGFACMDWRNVHLLMQAGKAAAFTHINTAVWNKGVGGMGGLYRSAHELVAVFSNGDKSAINNVALGKHGRDRTNVWTYPGANRRGSSAGALLADHPTPKPVELVRDALLDVTKRGDIVLDPFLGSGTTIIAANGCGRIGYGIELAPAYVDLIVRRWAGLGGTAVLIETGESFEKVAKDRM